MKHDLKEAIRKETAGYSQRLKGISSSLHEHPEISSCEYKSAELLASELAAEGFAVERKAGGLDTAFVASYVRNPKAPAIGLLAEYDALPEIGHACGHNLIAAASLGAAMVLKKVLPPELVNLKVFGTPAEETSGGKLPMLEQGVFGGADVLMMFHPHTVTCGLRPCIGRTSLAFEFCGKSAHASTFPDKGINALDAVILTFNNINALRQQLRDGTRVHGIITDGGKLPNIIPDCARAEFFVRSNSKPYMEATAQRVISCAQAGAKATGAELKVGHPLPVYLPDIPVDSLIKCFEENLRELGLAVDKLEPPLRMGSSDFGNVSQVTPSLMGFIKIADGGTATHSRQFADAAISERGMLGMLSAVSALSMTAADILTIPGLLEKVRQDYKDRVSGA